MRSLRCSPSPNERREGEQLPDARATSGENTQHATPSSPDSLQVHYYNTRATRVPAMSADYDLDLVLGRVRKCGVRWHGVGTFWLSTDRADLIELPSPVALILGQMQRSLASLAPSSM